MSLSAEIAELHTAIANEKDPKEREKLEALLAAKIAKRNKGNR